MTQDIEGTILKQAIIETFVHRDTGFDDIIAFEPEFTEDRIRQTRWNAFIKKKKAMLNVEFGEVLDLIKKFIVPVVDAINRKHEFELIWNHESKEWLK